MNKKLKILIALIVILLISVLIWFFFFRSNTPSNTSNVQNVLPFGIGEGTVNNTNLGKNPDDGVLGDGTGKALPHLFKISDVPVAGGIAIIKNGLLVVRYVERGTGHIVDVSPTTLERIKIVNTTVPKVYNAVFKKDGSAVVLQTLPGNGEVIESTSYALIPPKATTTIQTYTTVATPIKSGINELAAGINSIYYTTKEGPAISSSLFDGSKQVTLFSGAFNEWRLTSGGDTNVYIATKADSTVPGYAYAINTKTGSLSKLFGPLTGLTILPNESGTRLAYAWNDSGSINFTAINLRTGTTFTIAPSTFPEKCVWSKKTQEVMYCGIPITGINTSEPERWYQGITHYSDRLWAINLDVDYKNLMAEPKKSFGVDIDTENLFLSPDEDYLFFTNRNDLALWALKLD